MTAEAVVYVDVESAVREWTRDHVPSVSRRAFFAVNAAAAYPQVSVQRIGGSDLACLMQFSAWASSKAAAAMVAAELATAADQVARKTYGAVLLHAAAVEQIRWLPDDESDKPRYIVDVTFTATHA